ncbi:MAG: DNA/RNA non-specific endonuclease [Bacteroidia bacterium]|nr:DNA/RNA non-specific endonuclease [Bacteroidia bacterium]
MRPFVVVFLLFLVGLAAWLLWDKLTARQPPSKPEAQGKPLVEITDSSATLPSQPQKASSAANSPSDGRLLAYASLEYARAQAKAPCHYIRHRYYALCYDEEHEQPRWTVHILQREKLKSGKVRRTQDFRPDPLVPHQSAQLADYRGSGYDRGHLVPAGDFKWDSTAMSETFYLSNMSPQLHEFNAGIWEEVESTVRQWALQKGTLVVFTGPVLKEVRKRIGESRVSVPSAFYKVVYDLNEKFPAAAAFIVPHAPSSKPPTSFLVRVDSVEKLTEIDFFPALPDEIEERIESRLERRQWEGKQRHR